MKVFNLIISIFLCHIGHCQVNEERTMLVITLERSFNKGTHDSESFYWIIPEDSLETSMKLSPFYFSGYSRNLYENCNENKEVNPFEMLTGDNYDLGKDHKIVQKATYDVIKENKNKIITVKIKFIGTKLVEHINVYLTPLIGSFCNCSIDNRSAKRIDYDGDIFLPVGNIRIDSSFEIMDINLFTLQNKMNLSNVSNVPWH